MDWGKWLIPWANMGLEWNDIGISSKCSFKEQSVLAVSKSSIRWLFVVCTVTAHAFAHLICGFDSWLTWAAECCVLLKSLLRVCVLFELSRHWGRPVTVGESMSHSWGFAPVGRCGVLQVSPSALVLVGGCQVLVQWFLPRGYHPFGGWGGITCLV